MGDTHPAGFDADIAAYYARAPEEGRLRQGAAQLESEPSLLGASAHLLAVGRSSGT